MGPQDGTFGWDPGMVPWDGTLGWYPRMVPWDGTMGWYPRMVHQDGTLGWYHGMVPYDGALGSFSSPWRRSMAENEPAQLVGFTKRTCFEDGVFRHQEHDQTTNANP